mgnify:CR=1 FL=1
MDKNLIKEVIKEMIDNKEIEITMKNERYSFDWDEGITGYDVKDIIEETEVIVEVVL